MELPYDTANLKADLATLEIPLPRAIERAKADYDRARKAAADLAAPAPLEPDVLLKGDPGPALYAYVAARDNHTAAKAEAALLAERIGARIRRAVNTSRAGILDALDEWLTGNLDALASEGAPGQHPTRAERVTAQRAALERVHSELLGGPAKARTAGAHIYGNEFLQWFDFDPDAWSALVAATGPGMELRIYRGERTYAGVARACGGRPSLIRDWSEIRERYRAATSVTYDASPANRADAAAAAAAATGWARAAG